MIGRMYFCFIILPDVLFLDKKVNNLHVRISSRLDGRSDRANFVLKMRLS